MYAIYYKNSGGEKNQLLSVHFKYPVNVYEVNA